MVYHNNPPVRHNQLTLAKKGSREIRTPNLPICSQTRYRYAIPPLRSHLLTSCAHNDWLYVKKTRVLRTARQVIPRVLRTARQYGSRAFTGVPKPSVFSTADTGWFQRFFLWAAKQVRILCAADSTQGAPTAFSAVPKTQDFGTAQ